jgi:hypothetical protein
VMGDVLLPLFSTPAPAVPWSTYHQQQHPNQGQFSPAVRTDQIFRRRGLLR